MQIDKAIKLRSKWGDKPCSHPKFAVEYYLGSQTGDYICTTCGREFTKEEARALRNAWMAREKQL